MSNSPSHLPEVACARIAEALNTLAAGLDLRTSMRRSLWCASRVAVGAVLVGASLAAAAGEGPSLGAARSFAVLGGSTVTSAGPTAVTGDVGVSPGTAITGFPPATVTAGAIHAGDATATRAHTDAALAYAYLAGMPSVAANNLTGTNLGGLTLTPGVYTFNTSAQLTGALTLDAQGDSGAVFVVQIGSTLTTASGASVTVINGGTDYDESNVYWQVGSSATLGSGTAFTGNIVAYGSITLVAGSSVTGSALAIVGGVTLDSNAVTSPAIAPPPDPVPGTPAAPTNLTADALGGGALVHADLRWTDASTDETEFRVFRRDGASPDFVRIATVAATDKLGTGRVMTYQDALADPQAAYHYRITAYSAGTGESIPSNEARIDVVAADPTPVRRLEVSLGGGRSVISDLRRARNDRIVVKGSYAVIDVATSLPSAQGITDPRTDSLSIQVRAPGSLVLVSVAAGDAGWKALPRGVFVWSTHDGKTAPVTSVRFDTRTSKFTLTSKRNQFAEVPVNSITVAVSCQGASGSNVRKWNRPRRLPAGSRALFTLPR